MLPETAERVALSPRARIAILTLRLRAVQQEAEAAEADASTGDIDVSLGQLRAKLAPLVEDRRCALDEVRNQAEHDARAAVTSARNQVALIAARAVGAHPADGEVPSDAPDIGDGGLIDEVAVHGDSEWPALDQSPVVVDPVVVEPVAVDDATWDVDAALSRLQTRMASVVDDRRRRLAEALTQARTEADLAVAAAHHVVSLVLAAASDADRWAVGESEVGESEVVLEVGPTTDEAQLVVDTVPAAVVASTERVLGGSNGRGPAVMTVMIDADSFSQAFATAFATAFSAISDQRFTALTTGMPSGAVWRPTPVAAKKSIWTGIWHADFLLSVIAMIIVFVIFVAWST